MNAETIYLYFCSSSMFKKVDGPKRNIKTDESNIESKNPNFLGIL